MRFAEEIVAASFVPTWRSLLARALDERGLTQTDIATLLGVTQSAVSKHLSGKLGADARLAREPRLVETIELVANGLAARSMSPFEALSIATSLVREFENRGPLCHIHELEMPELAGLGCDLCVMAGKSARVDEEVVLNDLRAALRILENARGLALWLPHVGSNLARALPAAKSVEDVAAVPGALYEARGTLKVPAAPEFGVSRHVARVLLAVMRSDPGKLACLNLAPEPALLAAASASGLVVQAVAADLERVPDALRFPDSVPDLFHHEGAFGIEPQAYLVAKDARTLALRVHDLAHRAGKMTPR